MDPLAAKYLADMLHAAVRCWAPRNVDLLLEREVAVAAFALTCGMTSAVLATDRPQAPARPGTGVTVMGRLVALGCIGFAVVNVVFEMTDRFADGPYAEFASGIAVMNWLVVGLKALGAAVALLSVAKRPRALPPAFLGVLLWGAFAMLGVYALGSVVQAVGMALGLAGTADQIDMAGVGYVLSFLLLAAGYGVLAISYSRRFGLRNSVAVLGLLGAPVMLSMILLAVPMLLSALGLLPTP
jgi:hypothetical protein